LLAYRKGVIDAMKVLLISANTETINMPVLPLGMAFVARAAEDAGHVVSQINLMMAPEAELTLAEGIRSFQPDVIGISVRNIDDQVSLQPRFLLDPVRPIVGICRQQSTAKIVLGGAGYSIFPQSALSYLDADMGIQGEGESSFVELLGRMENGSDISGVPGLHYPEFGIANPPTGYRKIDRDVFPDPGEFIPAQEPAKDGVIWLPFQTRRGCPLSCSYCSTPSIEGRITRKRVLEPVIDALRAYASAGWNHIFFVDNTFNVPESYARHLCSEIGLRIYPETDLADQARGSGNIAPDDDLLCPRFYIEEGMEDWIRSTLDMWMRDRSNWVH